ncbi:MAG: HAD family hydrolase [Rickettsiales bacterium]
MSDVAIVWDFDGTLTPQCSTTKVIETLGGEGAGEEFWDVIHKLCYPEENVSKWEYVLAAHAPAWMYSMSRLAAKNKVPLNAEFFREFILPKIRLYPNAIGFLQRIKALEEREDFKRVGVNICHFIISAGLKELIEQVFPPGLITWTFGCRYVIVADEGHEDEPESVPVFCMDETTKTRSLYEISKGVFRNPEVRLNTRVQRHPFPFRNMIYIGDGATDVPALAMMRNNAGAGVLVYNPEKTREEGEAQLRNMRADCRADFVTPANFAFDGDLYGYIEAHCVRIKQRCEAEAI